MIEVRVEHGQADRQCGKKKKHGSIVSAGMQLASLVEKKSDPRGVKNLQVYRCKFCHYWHVGHWRKNYTGPRSETRVPA